MLTKWTGSKEKTTLLIKKLYQQQFEDKDEIYFKIGQSACNFLTQMPSHSPFRQSYVQTLSDGLKIKELQQVLPIQQRTISTSVHLKTNILQSIKYKTNVKRNVVSNEEMKMYEELLLEACPIKSGENRKIKDPKTGLYFSSFVLIFIILNRQSIN